MAVGSRVRSSREAKVNRPIVESCLERFPSRRVLVVGDVMLDRFLWGEVDRISPEAPVPVVKVSRETTRLGGAANVAANLGSLGVRAVLVGVVGRDAAASELRAGVEACGIRHCFVEDPHRQTTVKARVIARAQQVVRVDREGEGEPGPAVREGLVSRAEEVLDEVHAVVISDYAKGVVGGALLERLLPSARRRGLPVVVDPKPVRFSRYDPVTVVTPNQSEAARAAGIEIHGEEDCIEAARAILGRIDTRAVLVTRGEAGMLLVERDRQPRVIPAVAREVYDVTGAGDTVAAVLGAALSAGASLLDGAMLANVAAGIVVGKVGTATVGVDELRARLPE